MEAIPDQRKRRRLFSWHPFAPGTLGRLARPHSPGAFRKNRFPHGRLRLREGKASLSGSHHTRACETRPTRHRTRQCRQTIRRSRVRNVQCGSVLSLFERIEFRRTCLHQASGIHAVMTLPVAIIGGGGWGTALSVTLARTDRRVSLWVYEPDLAVGMTDSRLNNVYLPAIRIPDSVRISNSMKVVLTDARIVIMAVPSHVYRAVLQQMKPL